MSLDTRLYRALLLVYPAAFRTRHGDEMVRVYLDKVRDAGGPWAAIRVRVGAVADGIVNGVAERLTALPTSSVGRGGMDGIGKDLRYAARALWKSPGFSVVAVLMIGLGIGATTAIFSVVRGVLLTPLPYERPDELVVMWGEMRQRGVLDFPHSPPDFRDYREQADLLEGLAGVFTFPVSLTGDGEPERVTAGLVTPDFFGVLGVTPVLGRDFVDEDGAAPPDATQAGAVSQVPNRVILGHALWVQRYGADPSIVGRTVQIGGQASEVVGVAPEDFALLMPTAAALQVPVDLWVAARLDFDNSPRNNVFLRVIGRLRADVTLEQAQAQLDRIAMSIVEIDQAKASFGYGVRLERLRQEVTADVRPTLLALVGTVVFVLLIACANVSNLLLVRAAGRDREMAVRAALGGGRGRLIRQMLVESGLLAAVGGALGFVIAVVGVRLLLALDPQDLPRLDAIRVDGVVLVFTMAAAGAAALVFGVLPAVQSSRMQLADVLKDRGQTPGGRGRRLTRDLVVVAEVALSIVLLVGAGLMVRSFVELNRVRPGFDPERLLTFVVPVPFATYPRAVDRANLQGEIRRALEAVPGVASVTSAIAVPLDGQLFNGRYGGEEALTNPDAFRQATYRTALPGYFETMGTRVLAGRTFTDADEADSAAVVVVDDKLAHALWPDESAVGKRFIIRAVAAEPDWVEVIGVVEHQRQESLAVEGRETLFMTERYFGSSGSTWAVRASGDPAGLVQSLRTALAGVSAALPMADVRPMEELVRRSAAPTRFALVLIGTFGAVALVLSLLGLYGVLSYNARQRTAEIGVRMAFGAHVGAIVRLVVRQGLALAVIGVALGLVAALALTRVVATLLVGVEPTDPLTFTAIGGGFLIVALGACWIPARRAAHVEPVVALREE